MLALAAWLHARFRNPVGAPLPDPLGWKLTALLLGLALLAGAGPALAWRAIRRERRLATLIPRHEAFVCRYCLTALTGLVDAGQCPKCAKSYDRRMLTDFWEQYPRSGHPAFPTIGQRVSWLPHAWLARFGENRPTLALLLPVLIYSALCGLGMSAFVAFSSESALLALIRHASTFSICAMYTLTGVGGALIQRYFMRLGKTRHCAKCGYQQAPSGPVGVLCPECGAPWTAPGGTVVGQRCGRPWMLWSGILLFAVGVLAICGPLLRVTNPLAALCPTSVLLHIAGTDDPLESNWAWAQLGSRQLTAKQKESLAESLLQVRLKRRWLNQPAGQWFAARIAANELPKDLVQRYYREALRAGLRVPATVRAGQEFRVVLECDHCRNWGTMLTAQESVYFAGFFAGPNDSPVKRLTKPVYASLLDHPDYRPEADLVAPEEPGPLEIGAVFWFVVGPHLDVMRPIQWQPDGTPVIPSTAEWAERIELRQTVQVLP